MVVSKFELHLDYTRKVYESAHENVDLKDLDTGGLAEKFCFCLDNYIW